MVPLKTKLHILPHLSRTDGGKLPPAPVPFTKVIGKISGIWQHQTDMNQSKTIYTVKMSKYYKEGFSSESY